MAQLNLVLATWVHLAHAAPEAARLPLAFQLFLTNIRFVSFFQVEKEK